MSDKFIPISMKSLSKWVSTELEMKNSIFGIPKKLFFKPTSNNIFETQIYNQKLDSPFGVAAGPHTQMSQNLIVSWLCGCRFLELKTVQTLDELQLPKPCIDMQDEGYNVEWSQELRIKQSLDEYLKAWIIIHALHKRLGFPGDETGVVFNASIGYNYEGILNDNMQWFIKNIKDTGDKKDEYVKIASEFFPELEEMNISSKLTDNITLSTMHGCPPDEIGKIASYLINEHKFHTSVKMNPTALGPEKLRYLLNKKLGYNNIVVPDFAFEHDIKYADAIKIIKDLQEDANKNNVIFGIKLSNTLEVLNSRNFFGEQATQMYMSGRPLHALTVNLADQILHDLDGDVLVSFAGGADCFNVSSLLKSGMITVTACSDILRPGGYMRFNQWFNETEKEMKNVSANNLKEFIIKSAEQDKEMFSCCCNTDSNEHLKKCQLYNLRKYAKQTTEDEKLYKERFNRERTKTNRKLEYFDCIKAPCTDECPIDQKAYQYISDVNNGDLMQANKTIINDNLIPNILGRACDHECESVCTRTHYDDPIAIREVKRYISDKKFDVLLKDTESCSEKIDEKVAVIGSGPCGITAASYLSLKGYDVTIFEERDRYAGMVDKTIPYYRIQDEIIKRDIKKIEELDIKFEFNKKIDENYNIKSLKQDGFKYIIIAIGAQSGSMINLPGKDSEGVIDGITFLERSKTKDPITLGSNVGIIGGGDVAMDCARVANRLTDGKVSIIYRKTKDQMPAHIEELEGLIKEKIEIKELLSPKRIESENGKISNLICTKMQISKPDDHGRTKIIESDNSEEIKIPLDNLIMAVGQKIEADFLLGTNIKFNNKGFIEVNKNTLETDESNVYCGGDATYHGPSTIVQACSDGKKIAKDIYCKSQINSTCKICKEDNTTDCNNVDNDLYIEIMQKRSNREFRTTVEEMPLNQRKDFDEVVKTLSDAKAKQEVKRCLKCNMLCNTCVTVCPNKAIFSYTIDPQKFHLPVVEISDNKAYISNKTEEFKVKQKYQVAIYTPFCNECGNCGVFCPTSEKPYMDKPRFYNDRSEFEEELDNAHIIYKDSNYKYIMESKFEGKNFKITIESVPPSSSKIICECQKMKVILDPSDFSIKENGIELLDKINGTHEKSLKYHAMQYCLLVSIIKNMPELPENK